MTKAIVLSRAKQKRRRCIWDIMKLFLGTGVTSAIPTPTIEIAKQIGIATSDLAMCFHIYKIYFEDEFGKDKLVHFLKRAGLVTSVGGAISYIGYKAVRGILDEAANLIPPFGQIFSGIATMSETAIVSLVWLDFVHKLYISELSNV